VVAGGIGTVGLTRRIAHTRLASGASRRQAISTIRSVCGLTPVLSMSITVSGRFRRRCLNMDGSLCGDEGATAPRGGRIQDANRPAPCGAKK
jgi:hypothetical protein